MKYLFVHQNFPGQFLHFVRHLAAQGRHDLVFISEANANSIRGVRVFAYRPPGPPNADTWTDAQEFEVATRRAELVRQAATTLRDLGFVPDIIIGHHGWGELLNLPDVWPETPLLGYHEFFYNLHGQDVGFDPEFATPVASYPRIRMKNAINLLALNNPGHGMTPTRFQHATYPAWARERITVLPEGVDLDICRPDPAARRRPLTFKDVAVAPGDALISYVARDLEPYRGFHVIMRALPRILAARPDARVVLVGGDGVSYGAKLTGTTWREHMLREVGDRLDLSRVHFVGKLAYEDYLALLKRSDAHVYLTYPFVASWSLREALACGCAVVASDTAPVQEFITHRRQGLLTPFLDPRLLADNVLLLLDDAALAARLRRGARRHAEATLRMDEYLLGFERLVEQVAGPAKPSRRRLPA